MATYIVGGRITISRQEGDTGDIIFTVPSLLDLSSFTEVKFYVKTGTFIIKKTLSGGSISIDGQIITISLSASDTKGKSSGQWELEISNDTPEIITIGRGDFTIIPELIA